MQDFLFGPPRDERDLACRQLIERCGYATAALTALPLPGTEILGVIPIHVAMVVGIGNEYGQRVTKESALGLVSKIRTTVGLSLVGGKVAMTAGKILLPGLGGLMAAPFMFASTVALGTVARLYYERRGRLSDGEIKSVFLAAATRAKEMFDPRRAQSAEARAMARRAARNERGESQRRRRGPSEVETLATRLSEVDELRALGRITAAEFDQRRDALIDEL